MDPFTLALAALGLAMASQPPAKKTASTSIPDLRRTMDMMLSDEEIDYAGSHCKCGKEFDDADLENGRCLSCRAMICGFTEEQARNFVGTLDDFMKTL